MKIIYLGQAGFLLTACGQTVLIDPYLSDSVAKVQPQNVRRQPVDPRFLALAPDVLLITHAHLDHFDRETLSHYFTPTAKAMTVLAPSSVWGEIRKYGGEHNYILFDAGTTVTLGDLRFFAVPAAHSDPAAVGAVVDAEEKSLYFTGDTLYSEKIFDALNGRKIDTVFLPINGVGNNMNAADAARFAGRLGAKNAVPCHFGLFDGMTGEEFQTKNAVIPRIYEEIILP